MLRRKDLAKEFELITIQEIKNHNDKVNLATLRMNKIEEDLSLLMLECRNKFGQVNSTFVEKEIDTKGASNSHKESLEEAKRDLYRAFSLIRQQDQKLEDLYSEIKDLKNLKDVVESQNAKIEELTNLVLGSQRQCRDDLESYKRVIDRSFTRLQELVISNAQSPEYLAHIEKLREELLEKDAELNLFSNELQNYRKKLYIQTKLNEYFQNNIERLKKNKE